MSQVPWTQYPCDTYSSKMSKTAVIDLQSYGLFGIWTTLRESTGWCLWFSFFKYMRYEDHYRIICLSPHCKINYCILTSEKLWVICKDTFIQPQVHVTPLHGAGYPTTFFSSNSFATSKSSQLAPSKSQKHRCFTRLGWSEDFNSRSSTSEGGKLSAVWVVCIKLWYITWWPHLFLSKLFSGKLILKSAISWK